MRDRDWLVYLVRCAEGDQTALAALYDESSRYVYGLALRILRDRADAEEVTLDVYSQVWKTAATFAAQRGSVLSWIVMLTRSRAIDRLRTQASRARRLEDPIESNSWSSGVPETGENPEEAAESKFERRRIREALDQLSVEQRELIELAYFGGLSHTELAVRMGQPLGTVKTRIRSGMTKLRDILSGSGSGLTGGVAR